MRSGCFGVLRTAAFKAVALSNVMQVHFPAIPLKDHQAYHLIGGATRLRQPFFGFADGFCHIV